MKTSRKKAKWPCSPSFLIAPRLRDPRGQVADAGQVQPADLPSDRDDRVVQAAETVRLDPAELVLEQREERLLPGVRVVRVSGVERIGGGLRVHVARQRRARQRLQVQLERVDVGLVREVLAHEVGCRADGDEHLVDRRQVQHLPDRDAEQVAGAGELESADHLVGRLEGVRGVEVLDHQRVLDLGGLAQQPHELQVRVVEVADHLVLLNRRVRRCHLAHLGVAFGHSPDADHRVPSPSTGDAESDSSRVADGLADRGFRGTLIAVNALHRPYVQVRTEGSAGLDPVRRSVDTDVNRRVHLATDTLNARRGPV